MKSSIEPRDCGITRARQVSQSIILLLRGCVPPSAYDVTATSTKNAYTRVATIEYGSMCEVAMTTLGHLHEEELDEEAQNTAKECLEWLQSAHFLDRFGYAICDDQDLEQRSRAFFMQYAPRIKVCTHFV